MWRQLWNQCQTPPLSIKTTSLYKEVKNGCTEWLWMKGQVKNRLLGHKNRLILNLQYSIWPLGGSRKKVDLWPLKLWQICEQTAHLHMNIAILYHTLQSYVCGHLANVNPILTLFRLCFWCLPTPEGNTWLCNVTSLSAVCCWAASVQFAAEDDSESEPEQENCRPDS